ncbi:MAG TPA: hypothetical protein VML54_03470 [Candidatus Limnocylindrales bacterium]|nr:hypothetical protein [Candidatus Limnocylindrales bacterium]
MSDRDGSVAGYRAVATLYQALMTGLVLTLVTRKSPETAEQFVFRHFRRQHLEKFLPGLDKLGLTGLPHAVACAQYHYLSNQVGGVKVEYVRESDRKAWVRYPPPRWIWSGASICGIPSRVNAAMLHGWHGHNGVSLGNPRLGFVCTGQTVDGDPGLEGYYHEHDRDLAPDERVRFVRDERAPDFDPAAAPRLDTASWSAPRLDKVLRSYAMEYVRSMLPEMLALVGTEETRTLVGHAARLIGMQLYDETAARLGVRARDAAAFAAYLAAMARAQGEEVEVDATGREAVVRQAGWRLMRGIEPLDPAAFDGWNGLWEGALAVHNRRLTLTVSLPSGGRVEWRIGS